MKAWDAFVKIVDDSGLSKSALGVSLGHSTRYLRNTMSRGSLPRVDNFATIADACGYDLILRRRSDDSEFTIDPNSDD